MPMPAGIVISAAKIPINKAGLAFPHVVVNLRKSLWHQMSNRSLFDILVALF